jgi:bacterioferritin (cytochrome b1)
MTPDEIYARLNNDLSNEWAHMQFYLYHASAVTGLHAHEYKEFFLEQAASEMKHVQQFSDMLRGLGVTPTTDIAPFPKLTDVRDILRYAREMEREVVRNYVERIAQLERATWPLAIDAFVVADLKWVEIFLEKQIEDSRQDLDHINQLLKGI